MRHRVVVSSCLLLVACVGVLRGEDVGQDKAAHIEPGGSSTKDKSGFTFLNPTPVALMREMDTDRPDKTETPHTVDAGHFQIEMDLVSHTRDRNDSERGDERFTGVSVAPINIKAGLFNNLDAEVIVEIWRTERLENKTTGQVERHSGFGDITPRLKYNLWGNDGGETALSLMPFVILPSNQGGLGNKAVEGGLILPASFELPWGIGLGTTFEYSWARNKENRCYHFEATHSIVLDHEITSRLEAYVEFYSAVSTENGAGLILTFDAGTAYRITKNFRLDAGVNIGLTRAADDWNPFVGLSYRY